MSIVKNIVKFLTSSKEESKAPEGMCPNCWGRSEYSGKFYEAIKNENIDINEADQRVGWIQQYADTHLSEIKLVPHKEGVVCQKCKISYAPTD